MSRSSSRSRSRSRGRKDPKRVAAGKKAHRTRMRNQRKSQSRSRSRSFSKRSRSRRVSKRSKEQVAYDAYMRKFNRYLEKLAQYEKKYGRVHGAQREPFGHHGSFEAPSSVSRSFLSPTAVSMEIVSPDVVTRSAENDGYDLPPSYEDVMLDSSFSASSPRAEDLSEPSPSLSLLKESSFESPTSEIALDKLVAKAPVALLDDKGKEEAMEPPQKQLKVWDIQSEVLPTPTSEEKKEVEDILREVKAQDVPLSPAQESELADLLANAPVPAMQESFIPPSVMTDRMLEEPSQESQEELAKLLAGEESPSASPASPNTIQAELKEQLQAIPVSKYIELYNLLEQLPESGDVVRNFIMNRFGVVLPSLEVVQELYNKVKGTIQGSNDSDLIKRTIASVILTIIRKGGVIDSKKFVSFYTKEQMEQYLDDIRQDKDLRLTLRPLGLFNQLEDRQTKYAENELFKSYLEENPDANPVDVARVVLSSLIDGDFIGVERVVGASMRRRNKHRRSHHRRRRY